MPGICCYKLCKESNKLIEGEDAVVCLQCETGKPMHRVCWFKHNERKHKGKGECEKWNEPDFPTPRIL